MFAHYRHPASPFLRALSRLAKPFLDVLSVLYIVHVVWRRMCPSLDAARDDTAVPWYSTPAIQFLDSLDLSDLNVLELGGGTSSLFWARRSGRVTTIETSADWARRLEGRGNGRLKVLVASSEREYFALLDRMEGSFDVVIVDGVHRSGSIRWAVHHLADHGLLIVDNSDWLSDSVAWARSQGLAQIDFVGLAPHLGYATTTSLLLRPQGLARLRHVSGRAAPAGGLALDLDGPAPGRPASIQRVVDLRRRPERR